MTGLEELDSEVFRLGILIMLSFVVSTVAIFFCIIDSRNQILGAIKGLKETK